MDQNSAATDTNKSDNPWRKPPGGGSGRPKPLKAKEVLLWVLGVSAVAAAVPLVIEVLEPSKEQVAATQQKEADDAFYKAVEDGVRRELRDPGSAAFRNMFVWQRTGAACGEVNSRNGFGGMAGYSHFAYHEGRVAFLEDDLEAYGRLIRPCMRARYLSSIEEAKQTIAIVNASSMTDAEKRQSRSESERTISDMESSIRDLANQTLPK